MPLLPKEPPLRPPNELDDDERVGAENVRDGLLCCGLNVSLGVSLRLPNDPPPNERSGVRFTVERVLLSRGVPNERLPPRSGLPVPPCCHMLPKVRLPNERLSFGRLSLGLKPRCGAHVRCPWW